ncbi:Serine/threonine-protein kinase Nek10, partial [Geodia barretti]
MFTTLSVFSRSLCFVSSAISPSIRSLSLSQCLFLSALPLHLSLCLFPSLPLYMPPLLSVADFGLAKQKESEFSVMQSTVGTLSYWCPELVKNEPYTEKADIWAAGCILYQMATLQVPFHTNNILILAKKIAEVNYPPIPEGHYSALLSSIVSRYVLNPLIP